VQYSVSRYVGQVGSHIHDSTSARQLQPSHGKATWNREYDGISNT